MKNKIIAIALCLAMCIGALTLVSCTANTAGNTDESANGKETTTTEAATNNTEAATNNTEAETRNADSRSSVIDRAESMIDDMTDGMGMGDPQFSNRPHRGMTPYGK
ncbi:MAG: hypothetical protein E7649_02130 [Ruminococcaceae bacterium]|nr:hypothetical protein [Oscillospiraceae bacterium]